jgi:hypothetical protein
VFIAPNRFPPLAILQRANYESNPGAWRESFKKMVNESIAEIDDEEKNR